MNDTTNDIDAATRIEMLFSTLNACRAPEHHRETLLALIEERDALRERVAELERDVDAWREDAHKWKKMYDCHYESERIWISRVVELERQVESHPPADRNRELRERLVCAIWPQMLRSFDQPSDDGSRYEWQEVKAKAIKEALDEANKMLAAMRKGEA